MGRHKLRKQGTRQLREITVKWANSAIGGALAALASGVSLFITEWTMRVGSTAAEETCANAATIGPPALSRRNASAAAARPPLALHHLTYEHWINGKTFSGCRYTGTNNWSSVQRENSKAFVNKQSNEIRELLIMLYNITDILIISTFVTFLSQCLLYKTICHLCIFFATMKYLKIVIFF